MAPLVETNTSTPTTAAAADENRPGEQAQLGQQAKSGQQGYREYQPKQTRYNQMGTSSGEGKLLKKRTAQDPPHRMATKREHRPLKSFRKIERCYLMPMGLEYPVPDRRVKEYRPLQHQPTFRQRKLRPVRMDLAHGHYRSRPYRLTGDNYGYPFVYVPPPEHDVAFAPFDRERRSDSSAPPVGGVAVLPPVLGAAPRPEPEPATQRQSKPAGDAQFPMKERFDGNGMYIVRDYYYTPRTFHYDRYREYGSPQPLPHRDYDYELVYLGGRPAGQNIRKRRFERQPVVRAPAPKAQPAPVPILAPVVAPVAAARPPPPAREETPEPEEPAAQDEPEAEPEPEPPVVVAAAAVATQEVTKESTPPEEERQATPIQDSPPVVAAAAAPIPTPRQVTPPAKTPTPSPRSPTSPVHPVNNPAAAALVAVAAAAAVTGASAASAAPPPKAPEPAPAPPQQQQQVPPAPPEAAKPVEPSPKAGPVAAVPAAAVAAAPPPPPPAAAAAPAQAAAPAGAGISGALGSVQRSLQLFS